MLRVSNTLNIKLLPLAKFINCGMPSCREKIHSSSLIHKLPVQANLRNQQIVKQVKQRYCNLN